MWFVYVLLCEDGSLYTGCSNDVEKRFTAHTLGKGAKYTRSHKPVKVVYQEGFVTKNDALKKEAEIKQWDRRKKITNLQLQVNLN
jgi:putative endonuclease